MTETTQTQTQASQPQASGPQRGVLLLDDDKFLLDMYGLKFTNAGFKVHTCLSSDSALGILRGGFPADAVVFDLIMPEHDGFYFLETIRAEKLVPNAVAVALTNQSTDAEKKRLEDLGCDRYIIKASMIPSEVVETVKGEIDKRKSK